MPENVPALEGVVPFAGVHGDAKALKPLFPAKDVEACAFLLSYASIWALLSLVSLLR